MQSLNGLGLGYEVLVCCIKALVKEQEKIGYAPSVQTLRIDVAIGGIGFDNAFGRLQDS
jgi:hypothetical protein